MFADPVEAHTEKPVFHSHSGNEHPSFPAGPFLTHQFLTSPAFLSEHQQGKRDHLGGLYFILLNEGSTLNSDYIAQGFIQKSVENL